MDEDLKRIIGKVFSADDGKVVEKMLELVNKEISDSGRAKRLSGLDYILSGAIK
jgi:hypothetical protein